MTCLRADEEGHHAAQPVALRAQVLRRHISDAFVLGASASLASCCEQRHARGRDGACLHRVACHANAGRSFASSHRGAGQHASRTHIDHVCTVRRS